VSTAVKTVFFLSYILTNLWHWCSAHLKL